MQVDLLLRGGRVIDPVNRIDRIAEVAIADGKIVAVGASIEPNGAEVEDVAGALVLPGLVDFHTHVYWGGTSLAVQAEPLAAKSGVITFINAGTAGASNFLGFRDHVINRSDLRILAYLNISYAGIFAWTPTLMFGREAICACSIRSNACAWRGRIRISSSALRFGSAAMRAEQVASHRSRWRCRLRKRPACREWPISTTHRPATRMS